MKIKRENFVLDGFKFAPNGNVVVNYSVESIVNDVVVFSKHRHESTAIVPGGIMDACYHFIDILLPFMSFIQDIDPFELVSFKVKRSGDNSYLSAEFRVAMDDAHVKLRKVYYETDHRANTDATKQLIAKLEQEFYDYVVNGNTAELETFDV